LVPRSRCWQEHRSGYRATHSRDERPGAAVLDGMVRNPLASVLHEVLPKTKKVTYQQYTVALEQGEKLDLRSHAIDIEVNDCVRVWIVGPGVSPVYLYAPEQAAIERASKCASAEQSGRCLSARH